jgi:alpha-glucosidase (family GH31 glycosyl hydrolase)
MRTSVVALFVLASLALASCGAAFAWEYPDLPPDTSRQALTPQWAFGVWMWEDDRNTQAAIYDIVNGCKQHDLPLSAVIVDSPWETAYNNFEWDRARYPDPQRMINDCHAHGVRVAMWMTCLVNVRGKQADARGSDVDLYAIGKRAGYFANGGKTIKWWKGEGAFIDYTNPEAVEWWHGLMDRVLLMGVDGWKVDGAAERFPEFGGFGRGGPITTMQYVDAYYRDTYQHLLRRNPAGATMVRSCDIGENGYTGRHAPLDAAPVTWFGDQEHRWDENGLSDAVRDQFLAMAKGYSVMGTDIAGYDRAHDAVIPRSLYIRWLQWSTFLPFFLNGGHDEHRPWKYDRGFLDLYRRFAWTHQELAPYWYSQVRERHDGGEPFMKPGPGQWEYTIGDQLLVAIMYQDELTRQVAFPAGDWIDYFDNAKVYHGPSEAQVGAPLERYPVFVRRGSIIPLEVANGYAGHGDKSSAGALTLDIYPDVGRGAAFALWDEKTGRSDVRCAVKGELTTVSIEGGARDYVVRMLMAARPPAVRLTTGDEARALPELDGGGWEARSAGWRYDAADRRLWIRLQAEGKTGVEIESGVWNCSPGR